MITDARNFTHYPTDALNEFLNRLRDAGVRGCDQVGAKYNYLPGKGDTWLRLPRPGAWPAESVLQRLAADPSVVTSDELYLCTVKFLLHRRDWRLNKTELQAELVGFSIPVLQEPVSRQPRSKPRTKDQRIARLLKLYGPGGALANYPKPRHWLRSRLRAMPISWVGRVELIVRRTHTGLETKPQTNRRTQSAAVMYLREYERLERHREKLAKLGVEVPPYESYPEYLRRVADEYEEFERQHPDWFAQRL